MKTKKLGRRLFVIATVFSGTLMLPVRSASSARSGESSLPAPHSVPAASPSPGVPSLDDSAIVILEQYFCGYNAPNCAAYRYAKRGGYSIDAMIATVPDPVESGLGSDFDDTLESIQRAAEAVGFLPDRFNLPWQPPGPGANAASIPVQTSLGEQEPRPAGVTRNPEREPGLILFRQDSEKSLLVLFLIGETPTAGIHKGAFLRAARQFCHLRTEFPLTPVGGPNGEPLKVMGPTYSGSARSLKLAIYDATKDGQAPCLDAIEVISGSATAVDATEFTQISGVSFQATTLRSQAEMFALRQALSARPSEIAYLSEEGTAYGVAAWHKKPERSGDGSEGVTYLSFPIHIAELENAAAQQQRQLAASGINIPALSQQDLPLSSPAESRRDVVPLYSSATNTTLELILKELLVTIEDHRIRYVMIAATDDEDTIFLVGQVRAANPNATVIALNSHLLYVHSEFNATLRGLLVASPYPLFIEDQFWNRSAGEQRAPIQFASGQSEGAYNATLALLGFPGKMRDYGALGGSRMPPMWLSVVGKSGLWPVAEIEVDDPHGYTYPAPDSSATPRSPRLTPLVIVVFVFLTLSALTCAVLASLAYMQPEKLPPFVAQHLGDSVFPENRGTRRIYQLEVAAITLALLGTFAIYLMLPAGWPSTWPATAAGNAARVEQMRVFRASHLGDGVSPLMPVLLASSAVLTLLFGSIRRRVLMETHQLQTLYLSFGTDSFEGVVALEHSIRSASEATLWRSLGYRIVITATFLLYIGLVRSWRQWPLDGPFLWTVYLAISVMAYVCIASAIFRLVTLWLATRRLLHRLYWHQSRDGYARIREDMPGDKVSSIDLLSSTPTLVPLEAGLKYARKIDEFECDEKVHGQLPRRLNEVRAWLGGTIYCTEMRIKQALEAGARRTWVAEIASKRAAEQKASILSQCVAYVLEPAWRKVALDSIPTAAWDKECALVGIGEAYIATRVIDFLRAVMPHLRILAISSTAAVLLMLLAASSYPFPSSNDLLWFGWVMVIAAAGSTTWMFASMNRDRVISLISGTTPGAINWNSTFVVQLVTHALLPLMVVLGAAFPAQLSSLTDWLGGLLGGKG